MTEHAGAHDRALLERLSAYLDGDLPARECDAIARHAQTCRSCAAIVEDLKRTTGLCRAAAAQPLPPRVRALARQRIKALMAARPAVKTPRRTRQPRS